MPDQLFPLGRTVMTANLQYQLKEADPVGWEEELKGFIDRHVTGDWGNLEEEDRKDNQLSLERGFRIFSSYTPSLGIKLYIITEADRSITTALLPDDY